MSISIDDIQKAKKAIESHIQKTELGFSNSFTKILAKETYLKFENEQTTGSFKIRGALNKIQTLTEEQKKLGVVASSAGNHAQGVAYAATKFGIKATVVMPESAPLVKVAAVKEYGADVILHGSYYDEAYQHAKQLEKEKGFVFVHPYEDPMVIAGQGTLGLEILSQLNDVDSLVLPIGGGGLISGIATAVKKLSPETKIFGVQSNMAPGMERLFHQSPQDAKGPNGVGTIADGIAVKSPSQKMYDKYISQLVDEVVTVSDNEIAEAIVLLMERAKSVVEGAGAVGLAACLSGKLPIKGKTCFVLSGGNIDLNTVAKIIEKGLSVTGRLARMSVIVNDLPGNLSRLTKILAEHRANVLHVYHDRISDGLYLRETRVDFLLETANNEHVEEIHQALTKLGGRVIDQSI